MNTATMSPSAQDTQLRQCQRLARVLTITQDMLTHANADRWEEVIDLEQRRREDLSACFEEAVSVADSELIAEAMAALLSLNEELMSRLKIARDQALESGQQLSRNRNAIGNYSAMQVNR